MLHRESRGGNARGVRNVGTSVLGRVLFGLLMIVAIVLLAPFWFVHSLVELYRWYTGADHGGLPRARVDDARWWRIRRRPGVARPLVNVLFQGGMTAYLVAFVYLMHVLYR